MIYYCLSNEVKSEDYARNLYNMKVGDVEVILDDSGDLTIWVKLGNKEADTYFGDFGPHFEGDVGLYSEYGYDVYSENINRAVGLVKRTKIAEKLYRDRVWKQNEEWILVLK